MNHDLAIARSVRLRPIAEVAASLDIPPEALEPYGRFKAKIGFDFIRSVQDRPDGALVLVTGISPTPAGEGKTTTTVGLGDALNRIGVRAAICLREPSLGPSFGRRAAPPAAGGRRWRRWTRSTCTSPATSTPSPRPTTCWQRWSTTTSTGATRSGSIRAGSPGAARWT